MIQTEQAAEKHNNIFSSHYSSNMDFLFFSGILKIEPISGNGNDPFASGRKRTFVSWIHHGSHHLSEGPEIKLPEAYL